MYQIITLLSYFEKTVEKVMRPLREVDLCSANAD
jgi:hypothetical protein